MVVFYSTHCPKCSILEKKLASKNIEYTEVNDADLMIKMGVTSVPQLKVDGKMLDFTEAVQWINEQ